MQKNQRRALERYVVAYQKNGLNGLFSKDRSESKACRVITPEL